MELVFFVNFLCNVASLLGRQRMTMLNRKGSILQGFCAVFKIAGGCNIFKFLYSLQVLLASQVVKTECRVWTWFYSVSVLYFMSQLQNPTASKVCYFSYINPARALKCSGELVGSKITSLLGRQTRYDSHLKRVQS